MKNKRIRAWTCLITAVVLLVGCFPISAADASLVAKEILAYQKNAAGAASEQGWVDQLPAGSNEWFAISLSQYGGYDLSRYRSALEAYLNGNEVGSASSRLKFSLALAAAGSNNGYIYRSLDDAIGKQGLMSWVFGLHLLNNGYQGEVYTLSQVKEKLLSLQLADGGWAVMGANGDIDATAMALQALAPYRHEAAVSTAVERGLSLLSVRQQPSGGFASYGVENAESAAQVLIALSALSIDAGADDRFIKNGNSVFEALASFRLEGGGYCHEAGGAANTMATVQTFSAMVAYLRMKAGKSGFYILDARAPAAPEAETEQPEQNEPQDPQSPSAEEPVPAEKPNYKPWVCLGILCAAGAAVGVLLLLKKRKLQYFLAVGAAALLAILAVLLVEIRTPDQYYTAIQKEDPIGTVTFSVSCEKVREEGEILSAVSVPLADGESVLDLLTQVTAAHRIRLETSGGYVEGVDDLYEMDHGDLSGWVYLVNGARPSVGCDVYFPKDGDTVEWHYTLSLGEDIP